MPTERAFAPQPKTRHSAVISMTDSVTDRETSYIARAPSVRCVGICTVSFRLVLFNVCGSN